MRGWEGITVHRSRSWQPRGTLTLVQDGDPEASIEACQPNLSISWWRDIHTADGFISSLDEWIRSMVVGKAWATGWNYRIVSRKK